jgi:hypothetical protein
MHAYKYSKYNRYSIVTCEYKPKQVQPIQYSIVTCEFMTKKYNR